MEVERVIHPFVCIDKKASGDQKQRAARILLLTFYLGTLYILKLWQLNQLYQMLLKMKAYFIVV